MGMNLPPALLEEWMRKYYFATEIDIGSSGVTDFSMAELRGLSGLGWEELDRVVFHDSQTLGGEALRSAIAGRWADGRSERVMATHGSSEAIFLIMQALLRAGDEVVVLDPIYPQLAQIARSLGCRLKSWRLDFDRGFVPDLDQARALVGPATRMVVVNFPHNPTGATLSAEEQAELVSIAERAGAYLVWDNAFAEITYGCPPLPDAHLLYEKCVSMGTLSKCFGLPGLRVGWCLAAPEILARFVRLRDYLTLHLSPLVEAIAAKAIEKADVLLALRRRQSARNLDVLTRWAERHTGSLELVPPSGGVCTFPRFHPRIDVDVFCRRLGRELKVLLVPGRCFGHPRHVRLGFGGGRSELVEGLARVSRLLATTEAAELDFLKMEDFGDAVAACRRGGSRGTIRLSSPAE